MTTLAEPAPAATRSTTFRTVAAVVFYGGLIVLLALILTATLVDILPAGLAKRIGFNSEGYLFAVLLAAWVQFVQPRLAGAKRIGYAVLAGAVSGAIGIYLLTSDLVPRIKTLNETFIALALILPFVALRRPQRVWPAVAAALIVVGVIVGVVLDPQSLVVNLAETFGFWVLIPLTTDVFDRGILDPDAETIPWARYVWYAVMVAIPVTVSALGVAERDGGGPVHGGLEYLGRIHESFIGTLLFALYLAAVLGRIGRRRSAGVPQAG